MGWNNINQRRQTEAVLTTKQGGEVDVRQVLSSGEWSSEAELQAVAAEVGSMRLDSDPLVFTLEKVRRKHAGKDRFGVGETEGCVEMVAERRDAEPDGESTPGKAAGARTEDGQRDAEVEIRREIASADQSQVDQRHLPSG